MDKNRGNEHKSDKKGNGESKIPKSTRSSTTKEIPIDKELVQTNQVQAAESKKTREKTVAETSTQVKQTQITNQKNVKLMSITKISKDVRNQLENENLMWNDMVTECASHDLVSSKENVTKSVLLKEKSSKPLKEETKHLKKIPSMSHIKKPVTFGGIRFPPKKSTYQKSDDIFQKIKKVSKKSEEQPLAPNAKEITSSTKAIQNKEIEKLNDGKLVKSPTDETESNKYTSRSVKEISLRRSATFGGLRFTPKWNITPLKPDLFDNVQKGSQQNQVYLRGSSTAGLEKTPEYKKPASPPIVKESEKVTASNTLKETFSKMYPAFGGIRITPKRKSTHNKPDIFESLQKESKSDSQVPDSSKEQMKIPSDVPKTITTETQCRLVEKSEHHSTEKPVTSEAVPITVKETQRVTAFGGVHFAPKWESTPVRPDIFAGKQKDCKIDDLVSPIADLLSKNLKKIPHSTNTKKVEIPKAKAEKVEVPSTQKAISLKNNNAKNTKEAAPKPVATFAGLRFKQRQKDVRDVFETRKNQN